jgi:hypothetical protein
MGLAGLRKRSEAEYGAWEIMFLGCVCILSVVNKMVRASAAL